MESPNSFNPDINHVAPGKADGGAMEVEDVRNCVAELSITVEKVRTIFKDRNIDLFQIEKSVNEVEQFYAASGTMQLAKGSSIVKYKDREKRFIHLQQQQQQQQHASQRGAAAAKRMQELTRQFATILRQITQHKWARPFMNPVDVEGLGLHDYYEVIVKPMDINTIKAKMETKDSNGYKNVREIYADVRLVFKNAMKYNNEKDDVHVMAKTLLEKFEEKWLQLLPKVAEEEKRREEEEAKAQLDMQLTQEAAYASMARDTRNELYNLDMHLRRLKETLVQKCRRMSTEEKRKLGAAITRLSHEDLSKALQIVAENNPSFQATAQEVDLDIDAQSEYTLWSLRAFVKEALRAQGKHGSNNVPANNNDDNRKNNSKRRREICDAIAKTAVKRTKMLANL